MNSERTPEPAPERVRAEQIAAYQQFLSWASDPNLLVIDTETTGIEPSSNYQVWQFSAVKPNGDQPVVVAALMCRVHPDTQWSPGALKIAADLMPIIERSTAPGNLTPLIGDLVMPGPNRLVSYGGKFDALGIQNTWGFEPTVECALSAYATIAARWSGRDGGYWKYVSLKESCERENIPVPEKLHDSTVDATLLLSLIFAVARRAEAAINELRQAG